jgi:hypothetical protein
LRCLDLPFVLASVVSCAASSAPPAEHAQPDEATEEQAAPEAQAPNTDLESHREQFVEGCMVRAESEPYCSCACEQFREVFAGVDLAQALPDTDPRFATLKDRTVDACGSKLSERQVQSKFINACVDGDDLKNDFFAFAWTSL